MQDLKITPLPKKDWEKEFIRFLAGAMKYCFHTKDGNYPELDEECFYGGADIPGFVDEVLDYMNQLIASPQRASFIEGYLKGHEAATEYGKHLNSSGDIYFKPLSQDAEAVALQAAHAFDIKDKPVFEEKKSD